MMIFACGLETAGGKNVKQKEEKKQIGAIILNGISAVCENDIQTIALYFL